MHSPFGVYKQYSTDWVFGQVEYVIRIAVGFLVRLLAFGKRWGGGVPNALS